MKITSRLFISIIILGIGIFVSWNTITKAQTETGISFPVPELGSCKDKADCKNYCEKKENIAACVGFAEKHGIISADEAVRAKAFAKQGEGPGNCKTKDQCESFCDNQANAETCLDFAAKNNLISGGELQDAQKVLKVLKEGAQLPGGCRNKKDCENYCDDIAHINECVSFAEKSGVIPAQDLKEAKQVMKAISEGATPPGNCKNKTECESYCSDSTHIEECFAFAEKAGFVPKEELDQAKKIIPLMAKGETPGGCKTKDQCQNYCADDARKEECGNFALKAGLMKPEEYEMFKKTGGKGPGGCQSKDQCESFCNDPANSESCFKFAEDKGLIPQEKIKEMKDGMTQMKTGLNQAPPEVSNCLKSALGADNFDKIQGGSFVPGQQAGEQIKGCFEKSMPNNMMRQGVEGSPSGTPQGYGVQNEMRQGMPTKEQAEEMMKNRKMPQGYGAPNGILNGLPSKEQIENMMGNGKMPDGGIRGMPEEYKKQMPEKYQNMMDQGNIPQGMMTPQSGGTTPANGQMPVDGQPNQEDISRMIQQKQQEMMNQIPQGFNPPQGMMQSPTGISNPTQGMMQPTAGASNPPQGMMQSGSPPTGMPPPPTP